MYRIRLHGRGGQGIKTAAQILGSALFAAGFETQDAPRYGAERRGAPILAGVRAARERIDERGEIVDAGLVVVADTTLFQVPAARVLAGVSTYSTLLLSTEESAEVWRARLGITGPVRVIPPTGECAHAALPLVGAAARLLGVVGRECLMDALGTELGWMDAATLAHEQKKALLGFDAMAAFEGSVTPAIEPPVSGYADPDWVSLQLEGTDLSAPDIRAVASSVLNNTGAWRHQRPVIDLEKCNRCSWICSTLCPDSAIHIHADRSPDIDYEHCKGCMVCVTVCPPHAIRIEPEPAASKADA